MTSDIMHLVIVTGLSGSGKSVALNILEDSNYHCVDNLPAQLLADTVHFLKEKKYLKVAISVDIRSGQTLPVASQYIKTLKNPSIKKDVIFFDAQSEILIQRFSETRRKHPLSNGVLELSECISLERKLIADIFDQSHQIDTTNLNPKQLKLLLRQFLEDNVFETMLLIKSFGFKNGLPPEADFVFDVRCLANPYYNLDLRPFNGKDQPVIRFLDADVNAQKMTRDISKFLEAWIPNFLEDSRNYITIAIGCTGGKHRSVYLAEKISQQFMEKMPVSIRHRELE